METLMLPYGARTTAGVLDEVAASFPDRLFVRDRWRSLSYKEFQAEAIRIARGLRSLGVRPGSNVGLLMGNQVEWMLVHFATGMLGATTVALNTWWRSSELKHAIGLTRMSHLVTADKYLSNNYIDILKSMGDLANCLPTLSRIVCLGEGEEGMTTPFSALYNGQDEQPVSASHLSGDANAYLLFTSGSTGGPKAVQLTHRGCIENCFEIGERMHLSEHDRILIPTSMFWSFSCVNALYAALTHGSSIVLQFSFDAGETLRLIDQESCTAVYTQPNMLLAIHDHPSRPHTNLRTWRTGIARPSLIKLVESMGVPSMITSYGLTECYGNSCNTDADAPLSIRSRNSGTPLSGVELQIVSPETRQPLPHGETGEIRLRGNVTPGYYDDPERTRAVIEDGWFHTGDLGQVEADGSVTFHGRIGEMIKTGGINVTPAEVEEILTTHHDVKQAVVVGIPDKVRDEIVAAMVVTRPGSPLVSEEELTMHCRQHAATFKTPRFLKIVSEEEIPLTDTGKVNRGRAKEMLTLWYASSQIQ
jgi:fatty-acyl-CoA synthase